MLSPELIVKIKITEWEVRKKLGGKEKKESLVHLHKSGSAQQLHQNVIWKVEANVYLVNKLSSFLAVYFRPAN